MANIEDKNEKDKLKARISRYKKYFLFSFTFHAHQTPSQITWIALPETEFPSKIGAKKNKRKNEKGLVPSFQWNNTRLENDFIIAMEYDWFERHFSISVSCCCWTRGNWKLFEVFVFGFFFFRKNYLHRVCSLYDWLFYFTECFVSLFVSRRNGNGCVSMRPQIDPNTVDDRNLKNASKFGLFHFCILFSFSFSFEYFNFEYFLFFFAILLFPAASSDSKWMWINFIQLILVVYYH